MEWDLLGAAWLCGSFVFHRLLWHLAIFTMARATARNRSPLKGSFYDTTCKIDRLGRMSKLMIEMEYCHRQMQAEIRAMADDNDL